MQRGTRLRQVTAPGGRRGASRPHPHFSGWAVMGASGLALGLSQAAQSAGIAVFVDPMLAEFGWSRSVFSSAYTVATLVSAVAVLFAGRVIDRYGHRRVTIWTSVAFAASMVLMGSITGPVTLLLAFLLLRVSGGSILSLAARTLVSLWFARRRGRAISLLNFGKMAGVALIPLINALLVGWIGWRDAWRVSGLFVALTLIPVAIWFVRGRPEQVGQYPDGILSEPVTETDAGEMSPGEETPSWTLRQASRSRAFWLLISATAVPALVTNGLTFNQISIFTDQGLSVTVAATTFTVESLVALPVSLVAGWLADRYGPRYVLAIGNAALVVAMVWLLATGTFAMALGYAALRAITSGTWVLGSEAALPAYFGNRHLGSIAGVNFAVSMVGVALGPLPFALAYDAFGRYDPAIWGLAALPALTTVAALLATPPKKRPGSA